MAPSPVVAAVAAPFVGRAGARFGERTVGVPGVLILAGAAWWLHAHVGTEPHYWVDWFPGAVMSGLGINMAFPMLQASGVRDVGPARFSVANASTRAALQLGTAVGIAVLVAILGNKPDTISEVRTAWATIGLCSAASALFIIPIRPRVRVREPVLTTPRTN
jgi:MFS family permease